MINAEGYRPDPKKEPDVFLPPKGGSGEAMTTEQRIPRPEQYVAKGELRKGHTIDYSEPNAHDVCLGFEVDLCLDKAQSTITTLSEQVADLTAKLERANTLDGFSHVHAKMPPKEPGDRLVEFIGFFDCSISLGNVWWSGDEFYDPDGDGLPQVVWWREMPEARALSTDTTGGEG